MVEIQKLVLDVLKPLRPGIIDFAKQLNAGLPEADIYIKVSGVDDKTQDVIITLHGRLDFSKVESLIEDMGASIHSVDEVLTRYVESE